MLKSSSINRAKVTLTIVALLSAPTCSYADDYAYMATGSSMPNFGVVDLTTGVFTRCGMMQAQLSGLAVGPDHALYGGGYKSNAFYKIDLTNGNLTQVGTTNFDTTFFDTGSTTRGIYAVGIDGNLYSIDTTGAATEIGSVGITVSYNGWWSLSTNSRSLYFTAGYPLGTPSTLYVLNLKTGAAVSIGNTGVEFGATVFENNTLYGGSESSPLSIFSINTQDGSATLVSNLSGNGVDNPWGLAPIRATRISRRKICAAHRL
jgi:hypothetical protein